MNILMPSEPGMLHQCSGRKRNGDPSPSIQTKDTKWKGEDMILLIYWVALNIASELKY